MAYVQKRYLTSPVSPLGVRLYRFLEKNEEERPFTFVPEHYLVNRAMKEGYSDSSIKTSLFELRDIVNVATRWDPASSSLEYGFAPMTARERAELSENLAWFDAL
jgi:hypothetical protein